MATTCRRLEGRVALITGAAQGFGLATAERLAEEGADIALLDLQADGVSAAAVHVAATSGGATIGLAADVSAKEQVDAAVRQVIDRFGRIDALVNSAGILRLSDILACSEDEWDRVLGVHLKGTFLLCKAVLPSMVARRFGRIVNLSSSAGKQGGILSGIAYNTAKGGILSFTMSLARQFAPFGITANAVCPGTADTAMGRQFTTEQLASMVARIPLGRLATAQDVAGAIAYLVSDDASFVTGEMLDVNGGMYMD